MSNEDFHWNSTFTLKFIIGLLLAFRINKVCSLLERCNCTSDYFIIVYYMLQPFETIRRCKWLPIYAHYTLEKLRWNYWQKAYWIILTIDALRPVTRESFYLRCWKSTHRALVSFPVGNVFQILQVAFLYQNPDILLSRLLITAGWCIHLRRQAELEAAKFMSPVLKRLANKVSDGLRSYRGAAGAPLLNPFWLVASLRSLCLLE